MGGKPREGKHARQANSGPSLLEAAQRTHLELGLDEVDHLVVERVERLWAVERDSSECMNSFERHDGLPSGGRSGQVL